jgi:hypothetical protein
MEHDSTYFQRQFAGHRLIGFCTDGRVVLELELSLEPAFLQEVRKDQCRARGNVLPEHSPLGRSGGNCSFQSLEKGYIRRKEAESNVTAKLTV